MPENAFFVTIPCMNKIKILFVDHTPFVGGAQLRLAEDIQWLDRNKFDPYLLIDSASQYEHLYARSNVKVLKIPFSRLNLLHPIAIPRLLRAIKAFSAIIAKIEPDVVLTNTTRALLIAALASKIHRSDFKLINYIRDYDYPKWIFQLIGDEVDKYLFVSESVKNFYKLPGETIYLGSALKPIKKKTSDKKFVIGYLGRLVDWKGAKELIEAFKKIQLKNTQLNIWGSGDKQSGTNEKQLKKIGSEQIKFAGFTNNPAEAFAQMSCYVLPSKKPEPFATTIIEAALAGIPIIATNIGGTAEFIKHEKNGLLVSAGDTNQLAAAMLRLIHEPEFAVKMADQAKKDAQKYMQEKFITRFEKAVLT